MTITLTFLAFLLIVASLRYADSIRRADSEINSVARAESERKRNH